MMDDVMKMDDVVQITDDVMQMTDDGIPADEVVRADD